MWRRTSPIYVDFVDYDEIAHHAGPESVEASDAIGGIDKIIGIIEMAAVDAPRPYRFGVLSDHGQSPGAMFPGRYPKSVGGPIPDPARLDRKGQSAHAHIER